MQTKFQSKNDQYKIEIEIKIKILTQLATGSRQVCEFFESETILGETIFGALSMRFPLRELKIEEIFSPERFEDANERLRGVIRELKLEPFEDEAEDEEDEENGNLRAPTAAMDAMKAQTFKAKLRERD